MINLKSTIKIALLLSAIIIIGIVVKTTYDDKKQGTQSTKKEFIVKNDEKLSNTYMESSPFVWNNRLKYLIAERDDKAKYYQLVIYDFETRKKEVAFGKGLGLGSATVIDGILYVTATSNWYEFGKSKVYIITSKDLKTFTKPMQIFQAEEKQKIFNTSITKDSKNGKFILAYESHDDKSVPFTIYFLESKDGRKWNPVSNAIFGKNIYVACPTITYLDGYYYLLFGKEEYYDPNCPKCRSYTTEISRSKDLKKWETSPKHFMVADRKDEGINTADIDLAQYNGKTYIIYSIGNQATWGGLKYALYNGTIKSLFENYFTYRN